MRVVDFCEFYVLRVSSIDLAVIVGYRVVYKHLVFDQCEHVALSSQFEISMGTAFVPCSTLIYGLKIRSRIFSDHQDIQTSSYIYQSFRSSARSDIFQWA